MMERKTWGRYAGFTLIELVIVVMIIGVLAVIALPAYQEYVNKGRRAEAVSALMERAQWLERQYSASGTYLEDGALVGNYPIAVPAAGSANYNIDVQGAATASTFTLRATRAGSMAGDGCGNFEITHTGARQLNGNTKPLAECWRQ